MKNAVALVLALAALPLAALPADAQSLPERIRRQTDLAYRYLRANLSPAGAARGIVVASPSRSNPDYFFHWVRDAALVMDVIVDRYESASNTGERAELERILMESVHLERRLQQTPNRSGGLGEPKFLASGQAYNGDWGRPQNDGPALRAITYTRFAQVLLRQGRQDLVRRYLYAPQIPAHTLVKADLEYTAHNWRAASFDLWEEVLGTHFYTLIGQKRALEDGAKLARALGDGAAADFYEREAREISRVLERFYDRGRGLVQTTIDRRGGLDYKHSGIDVAVILGVLHAGPETGAFSPLDDRIVQTAEKIRRTFKSQYRVNHGVLATVMGRYPEDVYDGNGFSGGNPWFLTTHAFAEYHGRMAKQIRREGKLVLTHSLREYLGASLPAGGAKNSILSRREIVARDPLFNEATRLIQESGRAYLEVSLFHAATDGRMSEQMNRDTGYMQGAHDLSWSYASWLTAEKSLRD